jgi:hypothetical protein
LLTPREFDANGNVLRSVAGSARSGRSDDWRHAPESMEPTKNGLLTAWRFRHRIVYLGATTTDG